MRVKHGPMVADVPDDLLVGIPRPAANRYIRDLLDAAVLRHILLLPEKADVLLAEARGRLAAAIEGEVAT